jgi:hypothetical protein
VGLCPRPIRSSARFLWGFGDRVANTASVESDFSILKWEMDEFLTSLKHLSLEGVFQSKQMALLRSVYM